MQSFSSIQHDMAPSDYMEYVQEHFGGTKVDVNKPVSYLTESK